VERGLLLLMHSPGQRCAQMRRIEEMERIAKSLMIREGLIAKQAEAEARQRIIDEGIG
jgi:hypothetical protein